jgi:hypothetical protein
MGSLLWSIEGDARSAAEAPSATSGLQKGVIPWWKLSQKRPPCSSRHVPACLSTPRFGMLFHRADDVVVHHSVSWGWGRTVGGYLSLLPRATANETKRFQGTVWKRVAAGFVGTGLREGDHE